MASANPFEDADDFAPFSDNPPALAVASVPEDEPKFSYDGRDAHQDGKNAVDQAEYQRRLLELEARERELADRERELADIAVTGRDAADGPQPPERVNNFPPCYPIMYHSIKNDVPPQYHVFMYFILLFYFSDIIILVWNLIAIIAFVIAQGKNGNLTSSAPDVFYAIVYLVVAAPLAFFGWYLSLYYTTHSRFAVRYMYTVLVLGLSVTFGAMIVIGAFPGMGGILPLVVSSSHKAAFALLLINTILWIANTIIKVLLIVLVVRMYRRRGLTTAQASAEVQQQASAAVTQAGAYAVTAQLQAHAGQT